MLDLEKLKALADRLGRRASEIKTQSSYPTREEDSALLKDASDALVEACTLIEGLKASKMSKE
jgi:hypothetical protein